MFKQSINFGKTKRSGKRSLLTSLLMLLVIVAVTTTVIYAQSISNYKPTTISTNDFGSGSEEFSGVTYNPAQDRLAIVDDGSSTEPSRIYIYDDVNSNLWPGTGVLPARNQPIVFETPNGDTVSDIEGIAWIRSDIYAFLSETDGNIYIVNMGWDSNDMVVRETIHTIETGITNGRSGLEGIAYKSGSGDDELTDSVFYVVQQFSSDSNVFEVDWDGVVGEAEATGLNGLNGVYYAADSLYILSAGSKKVKQYLITENGDGVLTELTSASKMRFSSNFRLAGGVTFNENLSKLLIVSESDGYSGSPYTLGVFD